MFSAEEPLKCLIDKLIDGVQSVGKHDGEVTELSMCQWMTSRLASASMDDTVCILSRLALWSSSFYLSSFGAFHKEMFPTKH